MCALVPHLAWRDRHSLPLSCGILILVSMVCLPVYVHTSMIFEYDFQQKIVTSSQNAEILFWVQHNLQKLLASYHYMYMVKYMYMVMYWIPVNSYPCQLVPPPDVNSYHKWCQLVPNKASIKMMVRVDIYYHTIDVNSYPCQLVPMSTRTHVNSYH